MARPVWSGTISFGLIAIPVKLFHAVRKQNVSFNQLDERNLARIRYRKVNAETGDEVTEEHIVKGYEVAKGRYVVVDPDELEPFMPVATKSIDLEEFVDLAEIDPVYFDTAYHLAPDGVPKPYVLLARAMEQSGKVAIGRFVMRNKQYTTAIRAEEGRLVMSSLAYADEVVDPADIEELQGLDDVEVNGREVMMAESLVASLSSDFEPHKYHDEYREQVMALIQMKADGEEWEVPETAAESGRYPRQLPRNPTSSTLWLPWRQASPLRRNPGLGIPPETCRSAFQRRQTSPPPPRDPLRRSVSPSRARSSQPPRSRHSSVRVRRSRRPNRLRRRPPSSRSPRRVGPKPRRRNQPDR